MRSFHSEEDAEQTHTTSTATILLKVCTSAILGCFRARCEVDSLQFLKPKAHRRQTVGNQQRTAQCVITASMSEMA